MSDYVFKARLATLGINNIKFVGAERGGPYTLPSKWVKLVSWAYKQCDYCVFQLHKQGAFFGAEVLKKSFVIPNPYIPLCDVSPSTEERRKTIVSTGRFEYQKGFDVLIKAFVKIHSKHPEYRMVLYGSGPLLEDYKDIALSLGISQYIDYPGYVKNVAESIKPHGIFVLPSRFEGIPNALIEALSTGIPTISVDCTPGGPDFLTEHGMRGLLLKVNDVDGTANAINYMIENPLKASEYGKKGREVISNLEPSLIANQWENAFNIMKYIIVIKIRNVSNN